MVASQHNARIHAVATAVVVALGVALGVSAGEWMALVLSIGAVWCAEAFNTALEELGDAITREHDTEIGRAKDLAAGAVLLASCAALVVGLLVFAPRLLALVA